MTRNKLEAIAVSVLTVLAGACAQIPEYRQPAEGPAANVRFIHTNPNGYYAVLAVFDGASCEAKGWIMTVGEQSKPDGVSLGIPNQGSPTGYAIERRIQAEVPLAFGPANVWSNANWVEILTAGSAMTQGDLRLRRTGECVLPQFTLEPNGDYEIVLDVAPGECSIKPFRFSKTASGDVERVAVDAKPSAIVVDNLERNCKK